MVLVCASMHSTLRLADVERLQVRGELEPLAEEEEAQSEDLQVVLILLRSC